MQQVERLIKGILRTGDTEQLDQAQKKAVANVKRLTTDVRLDIRDYELSETRDDQIAKMVEAKKRLSRLQANILAAGPVFGPADVAQLDAQLQQINGWLE